MESHEYISIHNEGMLFIYDTLGWEKGVTLFKMALTIKSSNNIIYPDKELQECIVEDFFTLGILKRENQYMIMNPLLAFKGDDLPFDLTNEFKNTPYFDKFIHQFSTPICT
jgi:hypothetical protein